MFDYGKKVAADQMRTSMENIVQYVGTKYGKEISNELHNKATMNITEPVHIDAIIINHVLREAMVRTGKENLQYAREAKSIVIQEAINATPMVDADVPMNLAILEK